MTARSTISVVVEEPEWRQRGIAIAPVREAARLALLRGARKPPQARHAGKSGSANARCLPELSTPAGMTCLLSDDSRLRALNAQFRGKDAPTNVLAFPAGGRDGYLGDIAIALGTTEREATRAGIALLAHTLHLTVHGVLHLLGYDHLMAREARHMENLEIEILHELGIANPYARMAAE